MVDYFGASRNRPRRRRLQDKGRGAWEAADDSASARHSTATANKAQHPGTTLDQRAVVHGRVLASTVYTAGRLVCLLRVVCFDIPSDDQFTGGLAKQASGSESPGLPRPGGLEAPLPMPLPESYPHRAHLFCLVSARTGQAAALYCVIPAPPALAAPELSSPPPCCPPQCPSSPHVHGALSRPPSRRLAACSTRTVEAGHNAPRAITSALP